MESIGIYIHIPFCQSKCHYCDFASYSGKENLIEKYIESIIKEIEIKSQYEKTINTIYIGGGTPSYIDEKYIAEILYKIYNCFSVNKDAEISIEINPGTVNREKIQKYKELGINRFSIGLQSTKPELLKTMGRIHTYEDYLETINILRELDIKNINTDLIIGIPGQTIYDVEESINKIIELDIPHISVYSLIYEDGTKFLEWLDEGRLSQVNEEIERYMYWFVKRRLEEFGYIHYEISNFSKPANRCKYNLNCWNQNEYIGIGTSAASYLNNKREKNIDNIEKYIENIENNQFNKNVILEETQTKDLKMREYILLKLRTIEGMNVKEFYNKFHEEFYPTFGPKLFDLLSDGLLCIDNDDIKLTNKGLDLANIVWSELV